MTSDTQVRSTTKPMTIPPTPSRPPHTSSVARSLANAAAALRAQEWRGNASSYSYSTPNADAGVNVGVDVNVAMMATRRQAPRSNRVDEQQDRATFFAELRERHRMLTQRQRMAREFYYGQGQQQEQRRRGQEWEDASTSEMQYGYSQESAKRQRIIVDTGPQLRFRQQVTQQQHSSPPAEAAARLYRSSSCPPPALQLVEPRVAALGLREPVNRTESHRIRPMQMQISGSGRGSASPGSAAGLGSVQRTTGLDTRGKAPSAGRTPPSGGRQLETEGQQSAPSVIEDLDNEEEEDDATPGQKKQKKRVRYLRDTDRRNIIKRIENGEKQAALAREFGVTRAAICHIKKNRFEILSRYNTLVKSAQEMDRAENFVAPPGVETMVHEVRASSVLLLMTMLRDNRSSGATFRRVAGRLIMILLEEALAILGTESVEVITGTGHLYRGLELRHQFCGVAIGAEGFPFLVLFHQMEPQAIQGSIHVDVGTDRQGLRVWRLDHMDLPANIVQHKVLLFSSTCSTGEAECKAIEALCSVGCNERSISLVVILIASDGIVNVSSRFPQVKIISGGIDAKVDPHTGSIVPGFGDFVSRYNGS